MQRQVHKYSYLFRVIGFMKKLALQFILVVVFVVSSAFWGFFGHQRINRLAVFTLPPAQISFYKRHINYLSEAAVNPDRRRYSVVDEAARHYIDLDHYGDSAFRKMPRFWNEAVAKYGEDTLKAYGVLPWHVYKTYFRLRDALMVRDPDQILKISADLGHYIADAHVPLHTTENYNGQLTGQVGIHAFWESRLPELFADDYNFLVGKAEYLPNPQLAIWKAIEQAHHAVDSVLLEEKKLQEQIGFKQHSFETKGRQTVKVYSQEYAHHYHSQLQGMVERQMRAAIKLTGDFWYTAWVDAGQPDLKSLLEYKPTEEELKKRRAELALWKEQNLSVRSHE